MCNRSQHLHENELEIAVSRPRSCEGLEEHFLDIGHSKYEKKRSRKGHIKSMKHTVLPKGVRGKFVKEKLQETCTSNGTIGHNLILPAKFENLESRNKFCNQVCKEHDKGPEGMSQLMLQSTNKEYLNDLSDTLLEFKKPMALEAQVNVPTFSMRPPPLAGCSVFEDPSKTFPHQTPAVVSLMKIDEEEDYSSTPNSISTNPLEALTGPKYDDNIKNNVSGSDNLLGLDASVQANSDTGVPSQVTKLTARSRWRQLKHTVSLVNHMTSSIKSSANDLLENTSKDFMYQDAGGVGAAAFEGAKTMARSRLKGRKGMEGFLVRQDKGFLTFIQDFYVACLKMPISYFLVGVLLAPVALGLLFAPLFLLDVDGLTFDGIVPEDGAISPFASAKQRCLSILNVFLYTLSLSTTFGGSPIAARSPFCLLWANMNTLLAEFLFVFLSGAVFARMSQPSNPIRCSKKAIIKDDDIAPILGGEAREKFKIFAVRLVLSGPSPCELVDAKICVTFRIFIELPSGSMFCSTQDLELVRPEVSYLRYGLMVRHIIDQKSPIYGHTLETLLEGDASFSLTVMGMERASMQPIFHLEDYFVSDGDVLWNGDYADFIHINEEGQRVLDHSKIDELKPNEEAGRSSVNVASMKQSLQPEERVIEKNLDDSFCEESIKKEEEGKAFFKNWLTSVQKRELWKSKSTLSHERIGETDSYFYATKFFSQFISS